MSEVQAKIEVGDKVARKGRKRALGVVVAIYDQGVHRFEVEYPGRPVHAFYSEDELQVWR